MELLSAIFAVVVFPGFLFLSGYGLIFEWLDRKVYARFQNRIGPPWYQPEADFIKLLAKEIVVPKGASEKMFRILPAFAMAAVVTAIFMIPLWGNPVTSFEGDIIVVVYLLTIPTATFFLGGWSSTSPYSTIGAMRVLTQLFAYEVPLLLVVLGPAILAGTWNISKIMEFFAMNPQLLFVNIIGLIISIIALQGKLERVPFDIPHGETEIGCGPFTEYSGRPLAFFLLAVDMEMIVGSALINAIFLGGTNGFFGIMGFLIFTFKLVLIVIALAAMKALMARIRIEQMVNFCWKILAPLALVQVLINIIVKAYL
jgi:NADH-quinone oxidoreductase subunit H